MGKQKQNPSFKQRMMDPKEDLVGRHFAEYLEEIEAYTQMIQDGEDVDLDELEALIDTMHKEMAAFQERVGNALEDTHFEKHEALYAAAAELGETSSDRTRATLASRQTGDLISEYQQREHFLQADTSKEPESPRMEALLESPEMRRKALEKAPEIAEAAFDALMGAIDELSSPRSVGYQNRLSELLPDLKNLSHEYASFKRETDRLRSAVIVEDRLVTHLDSKREDLFAKNCERLENINSQTQTKTSEQERETRKEETLGYIECSNRATSVAANVEALQEAHEERWNFMIPEEHHQTTVDFMTEFDTYEQSATLLQQSCSALDHVASMLESLDPETRAILEESGQLDRMQYKLATLASEELSEEHGNIHQASTQFQKQFRKVDELFEMEDKYADLGERAQTMTDAEVSLKSSTISKELATTLKELKEAKKAAQNPDAAKEHKVAHLESEVKQHEESKTELESGLEDVSAALAANRAQLSKALQEAKQIVYEKLTNELAEESPKLAETVIVLEDNLKKTINSRLADGRISERAAAALTKGASGLAFSFTHAYHKQLEKIPDTKAMDMMTSLVAEHIVDRVSAHEKKHDNIPSEKELWKDLEKSKSLSVKGQHKEKAALDLKKKDKNFLGLDYTQIAANILSTSKENYPHLYQEKRELHHTANALKRSIENEAVEISTLINEKFDAKYTANSDELHQEAQARVADLQSRKDQLSDELYDLRLIEWEKEAQARGNPSELDTEMERRAEAAREAGEKALISAESTWETVHTFQKQCHKIVRKAHKQRDEIEAQREEERVENRSAGQTVRDIGETIGGKDGRKLAGDVYEAGRAVGNAMFQVLGIEEEPPKRKALQERKPQNEAQKQGTQNNSQQQKRPAKRSTSPTSRGAQENRQGQSAAVQRDDSQSPRGHKPQSLSAEAKAVMKKVKKKVSFGDDEVRTYTKGSPPSGSKTTHGPKNQR